MKKTVTGIAAVVLIAAAIATTVFSSFRAPKMASNSTVTIVNSPWDNMKLQVRIGCNSVPENNPLVFDGNLSKNQQVSYTFPCMLYYRREANPFAHDGRWTGWVQCFSSNTITNP